MKQLLKIFLGLTTGIVMLFSQIAYAQNMVEDQKQDYQFLLYNYHFKLGMEEGAYNLDSLHRLISLATDNISDKILYKKNISSEKEMKKWTEIGKRTGKYILLDSPLSLLLSLIQHEYFGHGARARGFGVPVKEYSIYLTYPIGGGGSVITSGKPKGIDREMLFQTGGSEANTIYSQVLKKEFFKCNRMEYYRCLTFIRSKLDLPGYIFFSTKEIDDPDFGKASDIESYITQVNTKYLGTNTLRSNFKITPEKLKKSAIFSLLDPMLYIAGYNLLTYIYKGKRLFKIPMIKIGKASFLPGTRFHTTPFGSEYYLDGYLKMNEKAFLAYARIGDGVFADFWGLGVDVDNLIVSEHFIVGGGIDFWRQPSITNEETAKNTDLRNGFNMKANFTIPLKSLIGSNLTDLKFKIGYKTEGFLMGEILGEDIYANIGLICRF